eukprot:TRINITY_DN38022_c0_g1_i1.p1 TRINITY_DN38022_c0_g1~~TRINITY_DN38022_c0_g1_i1.p1  ORF type:complete len:241 (-),score=0.18 TRINITY_DN38022_c0_g1_i1:295-1017(-)
MPNVPEHIGIVACSSEGAALCYRTICAEASSSLGDHCHPEVSINSPSLSTYCELLDIGDLRGVAKLMLESARKLQLIGAKFLICPDNTIHSAMHFVTPASPLPWIHIADVVAEEASARGFKKVGILGTKWLVESDVYPNALRRRDIIAVRPTATAAEIVHHSIMDELVPMRPVDGPRAALVDVIRGLAMMGCDAVVLGCTELPLAVTDDVSPLPALDSTRILARAALRWSVERAPPIPGV